MKLVGYLIFQLPFKETHNTAKISRATNFFVGGGGGGF